MNGEVRELSAGTTVGGLLKTLAVPTSRVAVERNGEVVPRRMFERVVIDEGDRIEVVRFVGGGS